MKSAAYSPILFPFLMLVLATPVLATDGVIEINQTRAIEGGITPGDTPSFPITITQPGSYRLTGNLSRVFLQGQLPHMIDVTTDHVTIDLNGFRISCASLLGGACPSQGDGGGTGGIGDGIHGQENLSVMNGTIRGMPDDGVDAGPHSRVQNVRVLLNRDVGVELDSQSQILDSVAANNSNAGFRISIAGLISRCISNDNGTGIVAGQGTNILESSIYNNSGVGIAGLAAATFAYGLNTLQSNGTNVSGSARQIGLNSCNGGACP